MTNLEHFKRTITVDNICEKIHCSECPMVNTKNRTKPCTEQLKEWCLQEFQKGAK